jgi:hypothetical protein
MEVEGTRVGISFQQLMDTSKHRVRPHRGIARDMGSACHVIYVSSTRQLLSITCVRRQAGIECRMGSRRLSPTHRFSHDFPRSPGRAGANRWVGGNLVGYLPWVYY